MQPCFTPNVSPSVTKLISHLCNEHQMKFSINSLWWSVYKMESSSRNIPKTTYFPDLGHSEIATKDIYWHWKKYNKSRLIFSNVKCFLKNYCTQLPPAAQLHRFSIFRWLSASQNQINTSGLPWGNLTCFFLVPN